MIFETTQLTLDTIKEAGRKSALEDLKSDLEGSIQVFDVDGYEQDEHIQAAFNEGIQSAINLINKKIEKSNDN